MMFGNRKNDDMQDRAEQIANDAADSLRELGRTARGTADDVKKEAVKLLNTAAETIRKEARHAGASHEIRGGADDIAQGLERAAHYLKRNSFEDMGDDMASEVRRNPWRAVGMVFVVGLVIGMLLRGGDDEAERSRNGYTRR